jgi:aspartate racemase
MKTLGLICGMTYHATATYYKTINEYVAEKRNDGHTARLVMHSVDIGEMMELFRAGKHAELSEHLSRVGKDLVSIGAEALVLCVNTNHRYAQAIEEAAGVPLLHIIDFSAEAVKAQGLNTIALLGTQATMEGDFIKGRLENKFGLKVLIPKEETRKRMDPIIFNELSKAVVTNETKTLFLDMVGELVKQGAQGVILGCTELEMVLKPGEVDVPLFDTVLLHARGAAQWALDH